ncbi:MAG: hypothetical protein IJX28_05800 [Clostridia bacterium]|nr:hypothetical protein [Clostridia bacterium]
MENSNVFTYQYSAAQHREVEGIRKKYLPKEERKIDILRKLDHRVQTAGIVPSLCIGIIGCLIFGIGMCFGLEVFAGADWLSVLFGALGVAVMLPAYPVYRYIERKTRIALTPEILRLSDEIMK